MEAQTDTDTFIKELGDSLVVQWFTFCASSAGVMGSIPGWGIRMHGIAKKKKKEAFENR